MVAATWAADLDDQADIDAFTTDVRASSAGDIERARRAFLDSAPPGELEADTIGAAAVLAFGALGAVEGALPDVRSSALGRLARTEEPGLLANVDPALVTDVPAVSCATGRDDHAP